MKAAHMGGFRLFIINKLLALLLRYLLNWNIGA